MAIDGPAASGKSVIGQAVAHRLGYDFFDTGSMYRAVTWLALRRGVDSRDEAGLAQLAEGINITVGEGAVGSAEATTVLLDGEDATLHLRETQVETNVSLVSRVARVREALVRIQRELAAPGRVVMAGRDIGTVVLKDAGLKVYLDASRGVRASRRAAQIQAAGDDADEAAIVADLARRDGIDSEREASPLTAAADAVIINTDEMTVEQVVERILELAR